MTVTYRDGLSIFQLIIFVPCLFVAAYLWKRDGSSPGSAAWRFATTLSLLRISGGIASLVAISHYSNTVGTLIIISQVIGTPPLSLSCITLADKLNARIKLLPKVVFLCLILVALTGLVIGIYGAETAIKGAAFTTNSFIKAAMGIFIFLYVSLVCLVIAFGSQWKRYEDPSDQRVFLAMAFATPFIGIKTIDSAISNYGNIAAFGLLSGNTTVYLLMSVLMEMIAIIIILGFGITFQQAKEEKEDTSGNDINGNEEERRERFSTESNDDILLVIQKPLETHTAWNHDDSWEDSTEQMAWENRVTTNNFI